MRIQSILFMTLGLAIAVGSFFLAQRSLTPASAVTSPQVVDSATIQVWVAGTDLKFGQVITRDVLTVQKWPRESIPEHSFTNIDQLVGTDPNFPRRAKREISQGELILASKVSDFGEAVTIVQTLGANTRAVSIEVDAVTSVGGFITPGDRVDIVLTQGRAETLRAATILQDIRVLGVDQDTVRNTDEIKVAQTITVEVTPGQGQKLALARRAGVLSLTLRTLESGEDTELKQITVADLMGEVTEAPVVVDTPAPAAKPKRSIKIRRGNTEEIVELKD